MKETFLVLLTAHLIGDFLFQNNWMVRTKDTKIWCLLLHAAIVAASTFIVAGYLEKSFAMLFYCWVFLAHFFIDWMKGLIGSIKWISQLNKKNEVYIFLIDQFGHIASLMVIAYAMPDVAGKSLWLELFPVFYFTGLTLISGFVVCVFAGGVLISKATRPLVEQIKDNESNGLKNGGRYIGQLERTLTFFFMLTGQTSAIGFLFAAKSILRFGEIKDSEKRKQAEYIIIGSFMSFGWALVIAYLTGKAITLW